MACCESCKISGMKHKKKHRVGGTGSDLTDSYAIGLAVPVGIIAAHELKSYILPMVVSDTATEQERKDTAMYVNIGAVVVGGLGIYGASMMDKGPVKSGVVGLATGVAAQALYSLYMNYVKSPAADGTPNNRIGAGKGWDAQAWQAAKRKALGVYGADNASPGVMGADNASPGVMGRILDNPLLTQVDQIGRYNRVGTCGL